MNMPIPMAFERQLEVYGCYTTGQPWRLRSEQRTQFDTDWDPNLPAIWREWINNRQLRKETAA